MDKRQAVGSWLSGPRAAAEDMGVDFGHRGKRLGLPEEGPGAIAPTGRRLGAIFVDWGLCFLIANAFFSSGAPQTTANIAVGILFVVNALAVGTLGFTPGKRLFKLRVVSVDGGRLGFGRVLLRTALLCLALPALIWDRDGRGLHDRFAKAVQVRL
ncbi:RDD family protein [Streptomyces sp. NPDC048057]|uniref:RDD family protein n=1 Tax=Streptomyces sp. NPDC048057 TaxID=3155628 RepID=UPI0033D8045B